MKKIIIPFLLILTILSLAACSSGENVATARLYLNALNEGNIDTATDYLCPAEAEQIMDTLAAEGEVEEATFSFEGVSCTARGPDAVECRYRVEQENVAIEDQVERMITFDFEDGQICGFEEEVAN